MGVGRVEAAAYGTLGRGSAKWSRSGNAAVSVGGWLKARVAGADQTAWWLTDSDLGWLGPSPASAGVGMVAVPPRLFTARSCALSVQAVA
jgi:hypothetical protein